MAEVDFLFVFLFKNTSPNVQWKSTEASGPPNDSTPITVARFLMKHRRAATQKPLKVHLRALNYYFKQSVCEHRTSELVGSTEMNAFLSPL